MPWNQSWCLTFLWINTVGLQKMQQFEIHSGLCKTPGFSSKIQPSGFNWFKPGFNGSYGENSYSLFRLRIEVPNLENQKIFCIKWTNNVLHHQIFPIKVRFWRFSSYKFWQSFGKIWLQLKNLGKKLIKPNFPHFGFFVWFKPVLTRWVKPGWVLPSQPWGWVGWLWSQEEPS